MLNIQNYRRVESLEEAWELNQKKANRIIGGMLWLKMSKGNVNTAIDMSGLGLSYIEESESEFRIGAMTSLRQLETSEALDSYTGGAMKEALRHIVGVQFRNCATVGGSIYGRYGFSDVLTVFMAMDSYVELYKGGIVPLKAFAASAYERDIIVSIIVKKSNIRMNYQSVRNTQTDIPVLTCAVSIDDDNVRVVIGARPGKAVLIEGIDKVLAGKLSAEAIASASEYASANTITGTNSRGTAEYRSHLVGVLVKRGFSALSGICE